MEESVIGFADDGDLKTSVIQSLAYSAVFSYPLTIDEIIKGLDTRVSDKARVKSELDELLKDGIISGKDSFYELKTEKSHVKLRKDRNLRAKKYQPWARFISRFIGSFPFVRAVFISGSLSKNSMDGDSDIDYFIITEPGRLWIARTLLVMFKKLFLFNSYKFFCVNYFIDSEHLDIDDHNIYTAHEIATLIPTYGKDLCRNFFSSNDWVKDFLPNTIFNDTEKVRFNRVRWLKWLTEKLLSGKLGDRLEDKFRKVSQSYWEKKHKDLNEDEFDMTLVLHENKSTYHPENFKFKVLERYEVLRNKFTVSNTLS